MAKKPNHKKLVLQYFSRNRLMTLGTSAKNRPWAATVFFAYDRNLHILFYSREDTRHSQHIRKNPHISVVINHDWHYPGGLIKGLQMTGRASKISKKDFARYYRLYKARFTWADDFKADHKLYLIKPLEIHYIDQKVFGHIYRVRAL